MRLTLKLIIVLLPVILIIIGIDGYLSVVREIDLFDRNMKFNAGLISRAAGALVSESIIQNRQLQAVDRIRDINSASHNLFIRWVPPDELEDIAATGPSAASILESLRGGRDTSLTLVGKNNIEYLYTYSPVNGVDLKFGLIETKESLSAKKAYTSETAVRVVILSSALVILSILLLWYLGTRYVGRPLGQLMAKTRRIGHGDFAQDLHLTGHHELSRLADSLNQMCGNLEEAQEKLRIETEKRFAALEQLRHTERLATVGRMASGIAHELGTPLNVITGRAKLIVKEDLSESEVIQYAGIIADQSERITKIIRQLLDFARRRYSQPLPSSLRQIAGHTIDLLHPIAKKANVTIELTEEPSMPEISVDRFQIQQVLVNLIMNGVQAMPRGGKLGVHIGKRRASDPGHEDSVEKEYVVIEISDEGEGISVENLAHIFDPFFTTKEVGRGTGLGLSIAYGIVEDHGGWIQVDSSLGKGSRFSIYLLQETEA